MNFKFNPPSSSIFFKDINHEIMLNWNIVIKFILHKLGRREIFYIFRINACSHLGSWMEYKYDMQYLKKIHSYQSWQCRQLKVEFGKILPGKYWTLDWTLYFICPAIKEEAFFCRNMCLLFWFWCTLPVHFDLMVFSIFLFLVL